MQSKKQPIYLANKKITVQLFSGKNDVNGNPNRIWQVYDDKMTYLGWMDDGYSGTNFTYGRKVNHLPTVYTSPRPYKIGQEFENCSTYEHEVERYKREGKMAAERLHQYETGEGYWGKQFATWSDEHKAHEISQQKWNIKQAKQRAKEYRAKINALKAL